MKFPTLEELASTNVIYLDVSSSLRDAIELMLHNEHRNVIVADGGIYRILMISDVVYIKKNKIDQSLPLSSLNLPTVTILSKNLNVLKCVEYIKDQVEYICTLNDDGTLHGIITLTDIISHIDPDTLIENFTLGEYLHLGSSVMRASGDEMVSDIFVIFDENTFDSVVIVRDGYPIGILTTKDILKAFKNNIDLNIPAKILMTTPIQTLNADATVKEALEFINKKSFKRVIVVDNNGLHIGAISQKELISMTYSRWSQLIKEHYGELKEINRILKVENQEYKVKALIDHLTGLYNRHHFTELFTQRYGYAGAQLLCDSLLLIDVDDFKKINDTHGHNMGDKVLETIAKTLLNALRGNDIIARWGGEEFIVLLLMAQTDEAVEIAQRLRKTVSKLAIDGVGQVTLSIGLHCYEGKQVLQDVIAKADKALYEAKQNGKNQVCVSS